MIQSVQRAAQILGVLGSGTPRLGVTEIAERRFKKHKPGTMAGQEGPAGFPIMDRERGALRERPGEP